MSSSDASWTRGLVFSLIASLVGAGSKLCIRKSYLVVVQGKNKQEETALLQVDSTSSYSSCNDDDEEQLLKKHSRRRQCRLDAALLLRGVGVFGMTVINPVCNVYAIQFASPSVLSPLGGGLTLVWVVLLSYPVVGEAPRATQIRGTCLIVFGEILIAMAGDHTNTYKINTEELARQYKDPMFQAYLIGVVLWVVVLVCTIQCCSSRYWRRFAWGVVGGSVTGAQNFIKDALALYHYGQDLNVLLLCILLSFAVTIPLTGLLLLMECMKRYDATYSSCMFVGSMVVSASVMAAIHYRTFDNLAGSKWFYMTGLLVLVCGIATLAVENVPSKNDKHGVQLSSRNKMDVNDKIICVQECKKEYYGSVEIAVDATTID